MQTGRPLRCSGSPRVLPRSAIHDTDDLEIDLASVKGRDPKVRGSSLDRNVLKHTAERD